MTYYLRYYFADSLNTIKLPDGWGLDSVLNGFWLTEDGKPTKGDDAHYFIPPAALRLITKVTKHYDF